MNKRIEVKYYNGKVRSFVIVEDVFTGEVISVKEYNLTQSSWKRIANLWVKGFNVNIDV